MIQRRDFIKFGGTAGAAGVLGCLGALEGVGGTAPASVAVDASSGSRTAQLERIAREFVTIPKEEGRFLNLLVKLTRATRVLELGTAYGYTTIWLAMALEETGGHLTTVEIVPERVALAKQHVAKAGVSDRVEFRQGDAHNLVPTLEARFDIAYLDADKGGNLDYFNKLFPLKLAPGSLLVAHNAILLADAMSAFLSRVQHHPELDTSIVRAVEDDGLALSYWRRSGE